MTTTNPRHIRTGRSSRVTSTRKPARFDWIENLEIPARIHTLAAAGLNDKQIALQLGICDRTVFRHRHGELSR